MAEIYGVMTKDYSTLEWSWATTGDGQRQTWDKRELAQRQADALRTVDQLNDARVAPITD